MATEDKAAHKATEVKGKIKEGVGRATDDEGLEAEGQADQAKGNLKQARQGQGRLQEIRRISLRPLREVTRGGRVRAGPSRAGARPARK